MVGTTKTVVTTVKLIMRWAVVGANGMLGSDLVSVLSKENVTALTKSECDVTNLASIENSIKDVDVVVNCAAYTAVDNAETNEEMAFAINATGAENLANICKKIGARIINISTDYVFDGKAKAPYDERAETNPNSVYGKSKLAGEVAVSRILPGNHLIVRTAWLYGKNGNHFGKTILNLAKTNENLRIVDDQIGQPTWTIDLSRKIVELVEKKSPAGAYHGTSSGEVSWFDFAREIFELADLDKNRIIPVSSEEFIRPAPRPKYSVLGHSKFENLNIEPIRNWKEALREAFLSGVFSV